MEDSGSVPNTPHGDSPPSATPVPWDLMLSHGSQILRWHTDAQALTGPSVQSPDAESVVWKGDPQYKYISSLGMMVHSQHSGDRSMWISVGSGPVWSILERFRPARDT